MDLTLNKDVMGVELSGIRQFTYMVRDTPGACALTIGEPDLNTPDAIKEAAKAALDANDTHYPPGNGYPYALEAISRFEAEAHGLHYAPSEIILTVGATEALFAAFSTILNPGTRSSSPPPPSACTRRWCSCRAACPFPCPRSTTTSRSCRRSWRPPSPTGPRPSSSPPPTTPPAACTPRRRWTPSMTS